MVYRWDLPLGEHFLGREGGRGGVVGVDNRQALVQINAACAEQRWRTNQIGSTN
jgi:hypothetical protein